MRCPACGAHNPPSAEWCTQCYATLGEDASASAAVGGTAGPEAVTSGSAASAEQPAGAGHRFRTSDEGVDWRCPTCDTWNPLDASRCSACGSPFRETLEETARDHDEAPDVSRELVVAASVVLPGAGHLMLGRTASGLGRAVLYVVWAVGGLLLMREAAATGQPVASAAPLLLGALALLVTSVLDALALHRGSTTEILSPRVLLWLTVGVIGLTMLAFLVAALTVAA